MEKDSEASNYNVVFAKNYPQELKDVAGVAFTLCRMKRTKLDKKTKNELQKILMGKLSDVAPAPVEKLNSILGKNSEPFKKVLTEIIGDQYCKEPLKKPLTGSDVKDDQARLSLKKDWVKDHIVPLLRPGVEDLTKGIEVTTFDMEGNQFPMTFKTWSSSKMNVLTSGWKGFYQYHQLKATQEVTVGMFRHKFGTEKLCFVISFEKEKAY